jgi:hypothetical protein
MPHETLVILGAGYMARFVPALAADRYNDLRFTSRCPDSHLKHIPVNQHIRFDLAEPESWKHIPRGTDLLWCFPAAPLDSVRPFAARLNGLFRRLVVLGSTSAYDRAESDAYPPAWIDETAPIDLSKPRVQGEELLRKECAAIVLRVAGIYGPGRHPFDWIKSGRVRPSRKYVNLIHVEDLAAICLTALKWGTPGEIYNVSDGIPRTWLELCRQVPECGTDGRTAEEAQRPGKRISNAKLLSLLHTAGTSIRHPDLFRSLEAIQDEWS